MPSSNSSKQRKSPKIKTSTAKSNSIKNETFRSTSLMFGVSQQVSKAVSAGRVYKKDKRTFG